MDRHRLKVWLTTRGEAKQRLTKAAGISSVDMVCHRDTWHFIRMQGYLWNRLGAAPDGGDMVTASLSGPKVAEILSAVSSTRFWGGTPHNRAIARRIYDAIAEVVDRIDPAAKDGVPVPPIVIDDKIPKR